MSGSVRIKIAFVAYLGKRSANGGLCSLFELASRVKGSESRVYTQRADDCWAGWRKHGIDVEIINAGLGRAASTGSFLQTFSFAKKLNSAWSKDRPDVVVCNDIRAVFCAAPVARMLRIPIAFFVRDIFPPQRKYGLKWRLAATSVDLLLCLSKEMASELRQRLKPFSRKPPALEILYSVVNFERMYVGESTAENTYRRQDLRIQHGIPANQFVILYAAGVCDKKNQLDLLAKLNDLRNQLPCGHIYFVGDFNPGSDSYSRACQAMVQQQGLADFVTFTGYTNQIEDWYALADCTLLASRREGLARCMIESLASGVPVVSFDVTSAREILEKQQCGLVAKQGEYSELFEQLAKLHANPELRERLGHQGGVIAKKLFAPNQATARFSKLLSQLTEAKDVNERR
ncbi:glycosyltransferase family 4 protein [Planctomycetaceae bacterium SH139]